MVERLDRVRIEIYPSGYGVPVYNYKCHCGKVFERLVTTIKDSKLAHCGCQFNYVTNWKYGKQLKKRWNGINTRTINGNMPDKNKLTGPYTNVTICEEWKNSFKSFYDWSIENGFTPHLHIDRIDSKKGYEPSNCRWVTQSENNRNGARSKLDVVRVREILLLHGIYSNLEISRIYDIDPSTLVNICKGVIWNDVYKKYATEKNTKRLNPKFLLPIVKDLKPGTIDFNNKDEIHKITKGFLALDNDKRCDIIDLGNEFILYSNIDKSVNNLRNFFKLILTYIKDNGNFDKISNRIFVHNKEIIKEACDFIKKIITEDIKNRFVMRLDIGYKIVIKKM